MDPSFATAAKTDLKRIILCSGKLYYELVARRDEQGLKRNVSILRLEELAPFPWAALAEALDPYMGSEGHGHVEIVWVQEEPRNQGPWPHVGVRLEALLAKRGGVKDKVRFIGRRESAVPAVGVGKLFQMQKAEVLEEAFADIE